MKHKHHELIAQWNEDNSIEFEFAYGTGVDFTWQDCDIRHVINNPSAQIRIKARKPKKEKRWIRYDSKGVLKDEYINKPDCMNKGDQLIEIEVEV